MIHIKPGSHVHTLISVLLLAGEFPMCSLSLLGSVRSYKDLTSRLTQVQEFRLSDTGERVTCRLLTVCGKRTYKTVRFHKNAFPLLEKFCADGFEYYLDAFNDHSFSGNQRHIERNHLVAESTAMCMMAGIESRPYELPDLMDASVRNLQVNEPHFYLAREIKQVNDYELNKIRFTRLAGAIVYPGGCYAVYNDRGQLPKWMGEGESKIKFHLRSIFTPLYGSDYPLREAAVVFGTNYDVALEMLEDIRRTKKLDKGLFSTYQNIFFVPMDPFGIRHLRILTKPNWRELILRALFKPDIRSYGRGMFIYDAYKDDTYILSFLDGDLWRLFRFREAALNRDGRFCVICFREQVPFLRAYLGENVQLGTVSVDKIEELLKIK